jgi:hypothetical protein
MSGKQNPLVKKFTVPMAVLTVNNEENEVVRIIETSWKDIYSVIYEGAYQSKECGHKFMTADEIEKKYQLVIERVLP